MKLVLLCINWPLLFQSCWSLQTERPWFINTKGYIYPGGDIFIQHKNPLNLWCVLNPDPELEANASSSLRFEENGEAVPRQEFEIVNSTSIRLHIEEPPLAHSKLYHCYHKDKIVALSVVTVGVPPQPVTDFKCLSLNWQNLTCSWTAPENFVRTEYELEFALPTRARRYRLNCPQIKKDGSKMSCFWNMSTQPLYRQVYETYHFILNIQNHFGNLTMEQDFHHFAHVLPAPPEDLTGVSESPSKIRLFWALNWYLRNFPPGFHHRILYRCEFCGERWYPAGILTDSNGLDNLTFLLSDLYPYSWYEIRVASRSAKADPEDQTIWSRNASITVRTQSKEPEVPPATYRASFEIAKLPHYRDVDVYWRQILAKDKNGPNFRYRVFLEGNEQIIPFEITDTYARFTYLSHSETYVLKLHSENANGTSANFSKIIIPSEENRTKEPSSFTKIALGNGTYDLIWDPPRLAQKTHLESYTIFWCNATRDRPYRCDGLLEWEEVSNETVFKRISLDKDEIFQFAIAANTDGSTSGMAWAECTIIPSKNPGKLRNVWIKSSTFSSVTIGWKLECSNRIGKVEGFLINYCPVTSTNQSECKNPPKNTILRGGSLLQSGTITDLTPSTTYKFTVFVLIKDKTDGPQSDPFLGTTLPPEICKSTVTRYNNQKTCSGRLIFEEDFGDSNSNRWNSEIRFAGAPDYEFVYYRSDNLKVENGFLSIQPTPSEEVFGRGFVDGEELDLGSNCTGVPGTQDCVQKPTAFLILPPVTSSQITTKDKFSFKFGKIEIRAKLPEGDWIYPQLFLNPLTEEYGPGYSSGQIRIAFAPGNKELGKNLQMGGILGTSRGARNYAMKNIKKNNKNWSNNFHTFTLVWRPDRIAVRVDGRLHGNIFAPSGGFATQSTNLGIEDADRWRSGSLFAPFDQEMYISIGVGVGGHCFEDRSDGTKPWSNTSPKAQRNFYKSSSLWRPTWTNSSTLQVDYVKVWAL